MTRKTVDLVVDLYKPSGKWAYNCDCTIPAPTSGYVSDELLLGLIAKSQNSVTPSAVTRRDYMVVIKETKECMADSDYQGFLCRVIHSI